VLPQPRKREIDHRTIKLLVGLIALTLASIATLLAGVGLESISEAYYATDASRNIFVGSLFAVSAFLLAYNGFSRREMIASKIASAAAFLVAMFPCTCDREVDIALHVHGTAAATMFLVLAYLCFVFRHRATAKGYPQAKARATIYLVCGVVILVCVAVLGLDYLTKHAIAGRIPRLTFRGEETALIAFGISWLVASRVLPGLTNREERFSPFSDRTPPE
jgi:hypothetical protein